MKNETADKERIAKILSENISFTGQVGIINIHHAINKIYDLLEDERAKARSAKPTNNQLSLI